MDLKKILVGGKPGPMAPLDHTEYYSAKKRQGFLQAKEEGKTIWLCSYCLDPFWHVGTFNRHYHCKHLRERQFACLHCPARRGERNALSRHLREKHNYTKEAADAAALGSGPAPSA